MSERLADDILRRIDADFHDPETRRVVRSRLASLWDEGLNVGPEQLARSILIEAAGDLAKFERAFDTGFYGDPRDLIMSAMARSGGAAGYGLTVFQDV